MRFVGIIPARYASTRFPGKPLADMLGKPMIQRVYEQVSKVLDEVCVATDDERIYEAVKVFGGQVVMTSVNHRSGTDRVFEAYQNMGSTADVVINIQGDEPFIQPEQIKAIMECFDQPGTQLATLAKPFSKEEGMQAVENPNNVKILFSEATHQALYFSRSVIPFVRGKEKSEWMDHRTFYKHIGMYAYRADVLAEITKLQQSPLELAESLEQLRWLENGYQIRVNTSNVNCIGIDTPEDMEEALALLRNCK